MDPTPQLEDGEIPGGGVHGMEALLPPPLENTQHLKPVWGMGEGGGLPLSEKGVSGLQNAGQRLGEGRQRT